MTIAVDVDVKHQTIQKPGEDSVPSHLCLHCQFLHDQISLKK